MCSTDLAFFVFELISELSVFSTGLRLALLSLSAQCKLSQPVPLIATRSHLNLMRGHTPGSCLPARLRLGMFMY